MKPVFLTHTNIYKGDFSMIMRTPKTESRDGYHYHDFYDAHFFYCPEDAQRQIGTALIREKEYEIRSGDAFLIRMFEPHRFRMDENANYRHYAVSINAPLMIYICSETTNLVSVFSEENQKYPYQHFNGKEQQDFLQTYDSVMQKTIRHGKSLLKLSGLISILAIFYNVFYEDMEISSTKKLHAEAMNRLVHYIEDHLAEDLSLKKLTTVTNFSAYYLCHLFKEYTSTTLNKYITAKRVDTAKKLLLNSSLSLQEISTELGFANYNTFTLAVLIIVIIIPSDYFDRNTIT